MKLTNCSGILLVILFLIAGLAVGAAAQMPKKPHNFAHRKHVITQHFKRIRATTITPYTRKAN